MHYPYFTDFIRAYTGLTLYDFRVLDLYGDSEKEVRDLFQLWVDEQKPIPSLITDAMIKAADYGFDVGIA